MACKDSAASKRPTTTTGMLAKLSNHLIKFTCGLSPSSTKAAPHENDERRARRFAALAGIRFPGQLSINDRSSSSSSSSSSSKDTERTLPCVAFPSQDGYMVFSLADDRMRDGVQLRPAIGRRIVPSPYGGSQVLATDLSSFWHASLLVDPFTGESASLPDLPVPLEDKEPSPACEPEERRVQGRRRRAAPPTDDGFAWDRSPRGVMIARGDTVFFCEGGGGGVEWKTLYRSTTPPGMVTQKTSSAMTVNYRGGFFFVLQPRTLVTTVIDARTLGKVAEIEPPPLGFDYDVDCAHLVASTDDVFLLVHRAGDMDSELFSEVYRARHRERAPEWSNVTDIGDRALFVDRLHGFSVGVGGDDAAAGIMRNCVYTISATPVEDPRGRRMVVYNVEEFPLDMPEVGGTLKCQLGGCQVEQIWGEPYWMIPAKEHRG